MESYAVFQDERAILASEDDRRIGVGYRRWSDDPVPQFILVGNDFSYFQHLPSLSEESNLERLGAPEIRAARHLQVGSVTITTAFPFRFDVPGLNGHRYLSNSRSVRIEGDPRHHPLPFQTRHNQSAALSKPPVG